MIHSKTCVDHDRELVVMFGNIKWSSLPCSLQGWNFNGFFQVGSSCEFGYRLTMQGLDVIDALKSNAVIIVEFITLVSMWIKGWCW